MFVYWPNREVGAGILTEMDTNSTDGEQQAGIRS
jgi:hypothetical protein